ncbi:Phosphorylated carbohydrates phosphatase [compost metagenome]
MTSNVPQLQALFFDLDGTLVDSEPLKAQALSMTMKHFGMKVPKEIYKSVMGQSWEVVLKKFFGHGGKEIPESEFNPIFREQYRALIASEISTNADLNKWLREVKNKNIRIALVSSGARWMVEGILKQLQLENIFDLVVTGDDVKKHKPDPEAYLFALKALKVHPEKALIFEDSEAGLAAAKAAGVKSIALHHDYNQSHDFSSSLKEIHSFAEAQDLEKFLKGNFQI